MTSTAWNADRRDEKRRRPGDQHCANDGMENKTRQTQILGRSRSTTTKETHRARRRVTPKAAAPTVVFQRDFSHQALALSFPQLSTNASYRRRAVAHLVQRAVTSGPRP